MKVISVNVGAAESLGGKAGKTGICKRPVEGPVSVHTLGVGDDVICNPKYHGGEDQAIYVYGSLDYEWWSKELGRGLEPGTFGENLTIDDLESAPVGIGDRLRIGEVLLLEVSAARFPCATLAARMEDPQFVKRFRDGERPGFYCRVLEEGPVQAGDGVTLDPWEGPTFSIGEAYRLHYDPAPGADLLERYLAAPVSSRERESKLAKLTALREGCDS